ncbi:HNH endonuclease [Mycobacterium sp. pUA109]|uniref:HNH endonuclease n=1 Tax=Mycobacterium sp. pUA109 TaxID=3238982 RepID=UPI00351B7404
MCRNHKCSRKVGKYQRYCSDECAGRLVVSCKRCGSEFVVTKDKKTFCSRACTGASRRKGHPAKPRSESDLTRAQRFGVEYEPISRRKVYERDNWTCGVCGDPVDRALKYPDPMAASLDHIKPLSLGGPHLYSNVQCAHWQCNIEKSDRYEHGQAWTGPSAVAS